jgi:hypothetical protein
MEKRVLGKERNSENWKLCDWGTQNVRKGCMSFGRNKHVEGTGVRGKKWHTGKRRDRGGPEAEAQKKIDKQRRC